MGDTSDGRPGVWGLFPYNYFFIKEKQMRKILALAVCALLMALAVPAFAESPIDFSGYFRVQHINHWNFTRQVNNGDADVDSLFRHRLNLKVTFHANEDIDVVWNIRAPHWARWGQYGVGDTNTPITTYAAYAEVRQPWGTVQFGRILDGPGIAGGLATLGYGPSWGSLYAGSSVFDSWNDVADGINYNIQLDNGFGFAAYYYKHSSVLWDPVDEVKDGDLERFGIEPRFLWDGGGATLGFVYVRDQSNWDLYSYDNTARMLLNPAIAAETGIALGTLTPPAPITFLPAVDSFYAFSYDDLAPIVASYPGFDSTATPIYLWNVKKKKDYTFIVNPAFTHAWGPFSIGFEAAFAWGQTSFIAGVSPDNPNLVTSANATIYPYTFDVDKYGYGLYFDATYNYGSGDVSFLFWLADGTDWDSDDAFHDAIGLGDFSPFTVAFGYNGLGGGHALAGGSLNEYAFNTGGNTLSGYVDLLTGILGGGGNAGGSNQWGIGLLGNHTITDDISINWGIGYFALVNAYYSKVEDPIWQTFFNDSKDLGWEIDLGASFQLLDNLKFETQFGYFFNGSAFDQIVDVDANGHAVWKKAKDTFSWFNALTVSF
jgi:hypothetical protein